MKAVCILLVAALAFSAFGKDIEIKLSDAPAGVQATVKKVVDAWATLDKIELEEGSAGKFYGAKITDKNGVRWEIIMDAEGRVAKTEQKKPKKDK